MKFDRTPSIKGRVSRYFVLFHLSVITPSTSFNSDHQRRLTMSSPGLSMNEQPELSFISHFLYFEQPSSLLQLKVCRSFAEPPIRVEDETFQRFRQRHHPAGSHAHKITSMKTPASAKSGHLPCHLDAKMVMSATTNKGPLPVLSSLAIPNSAHRTISVRLRSFHGIVSAQ